MGARIYLLICVFFTFYLFLGYNLYRLQIEQGSHYLERVQARIAAVNELQMKRGGIFLTDRHGNSIPVARSREFPMIFAVPKDIDEPEAVAAAISPITGEDESVLAGALSNKKSQWRPIAHRASKELVQEISNLNLGGIHVIEQQYRFYPYGTLAAHLLGYVGFTEELQVPTGLYGVEKFYEARLREGGDAKLTIDREISARADDLLDRVIEERGAVGGTIIVQEPKTGKIIAMVNRPAFDPNDYGKFPTSSFLNPATQLVYEPGSVMKTVTVAAGIDGGHFAAETEFFDGGSITLDGRTIRNWDGKANGKVTVRQIHENSINIGAVLAGQKIGREKFYGYLKSFGFGEPTGIDLPDEVGGSLRNLERKDSRSIDLATAAFGQGTAVTPLQLVNAFSAIANGGVLMRPYVNAESEPKVVRRAISEETAREVIDIMVSSVDKNIVAAIPGFAVAGKTGTALIPDFGKGGYTEEMIHNYVGFAPASNPKFVILVKLDKPQGVGVLAGRTVVPAFKELAQFILNYYNIPPDRL